jgi:hypothetical protein
MESWKELVSSDDFILRKHALRRIRELHDPAFVPLLEEHLEREKLAGNRALTALTLGELFLDGEEEARGKDLLDGIPEDNILYPVARLSLAEWAEKKGDYAGALRFFEQAQTSSTTVIIDPERIEGLRSLVDGKDVDGKETEEPAETEPEQE